MDRYETDYHITDVMPKFKERAIIDMEGVCPLCKSKSTYYICNRRRFTWQNDYRCDECGTTWKGYTYNLNNDMVKVSPVELAIREFIGAMPM